MSLSKLKSLLFENYSIIIAIGCIVVSSYLLFLNLSFVPFFGDQGFFYLSARDLVLKHNIPLIGITATHTWLHQGPLWTYMLAFMLFIFRFNPLSGVYLTIFLTILSVYLIYKIGNLYFSKNVGIISVIVYSTSNLIIINGRLAYHTSPIPFFTLLFLYSIYKLLKNKNYFLPLTIFLAGILYNLEISNVSFFIIIFIVLFFGFYKKSECILNLKSKKNILLSIFAFIIPMLPIGIYDVTHGFPQSIKFIEWIFYHIFQMLGLFKTNLDNSQTTWHQVFNIYLTNYKNLVFPINLIISSMFLILILSIFYRDLFINLKNKKYNLGLILISLIFIILTLSYFFSKTADNSYLLPLAPIIILMFGYTLDKLFFKHKIVLCLILIIFTIINIYSLFKNNFYSTIKFSDRVNISKQIVKIAKDRKYNLSYFGAINGYPSSTMNYQYLAWYYGNEPTTNVEKLKFKIIEDGNNVYLKIIN